MKWTGASQDRTRPRFVELSVTLYGGEGTRPREEIRDQGSFAGFRLLGLFINVRGFILEFRS